jgi:hypothetical protein
MPHKGHFTQCLVILLRSPVSLRDIQDRLSGFSAQEVTNPKSFGWFGGIPALVMPFRPEVNGTVVVDFIDRPWPDQMGDPKSEAELFGAWAFGNFGLAWPQGLARACQQSWQWPDGKTTVPLGHSAFLRVRSSYVGGAPGNAPCMPADYEPMGELKFVSRVAASLAGLPQALCCFNPGGELVCDPGDFAARLVRAEARDAFLIDLCCNVRVCGLDDWAPGSGWCLMDTVGMGQLDAPDHEAIFLSAAYDGRDVKAFLQNAAAYILENGPIIFSGETMGGPGDVLWQATRLEKGRLVPERAVIRWLPLDGHPGPPGVTELLKPPAVH